MEVFKGIDIMMAFDGYHSLLSVSQTEQLLEEMADPIVQDLLLLQSVHFRDREYVASCTTSTKIQNLDGKNVHISQRFKFDSHGDSTTWLCVNRLQGSKSRYNTTVTDQMHRRSLKLKKKMSDSDSEMAKAFKDIPSAQPPTITVIPINFDMDSWDNEDDNEDSGQNRPLYLNSEEDADFVFVQTKKASRFPVPRLPR
ncbi:Hypothetical predicted protein [Mytilus galloprovincialis]|uniref:Uncharacterized protein n=1 Tax=Mytilus galloprovincialis TaxID=29158 RepID=A0A8B6HH18_MYTGA|nr:Hypothetical predicted protein [Mytilus galloprovincialis]